jgi:ribosomal protein S18 acetylase RimI-like enzyme
MPEIQIRPLEPADLPVLIALDHNYSTEFVWQMDVQSEEGQVEVRFREIRLPRSVRVEYPRPPASLADDWQEVSGLLVAELEGEPVGYATLQLGLAPETTWITNLAVKPRFRRQGIGTTLILAAQEWGAEHDTRILVLEMQTKNYPAIRMAQKLGFEFSGYNDRYYTNRDIGIFFAASLR